jgi:cephalosporin hydroxylase
MIFPDAPPTMTSVNPLNPKDPQQIALMGTDPQVRQLSSDLFDAVSRYRYSYNFSWLGRPIIQFPQDIVAIQELIWKVRPDLIIETGIAHGGSLVFSASMLELLGGDGFVLGVDIDIRAHNRQAIEEHPMSKRIQMIQGSSIDESIARQVREVAQGKQRVMVILDSNHTHDHVLEELRLYSPLVTEGSYLVVLDTVIEDMPADAFPDRPWSRGNNPKTAVREFLKTNTRFVIEDEIANKLLMTVAPDGYLRCIAS